MLDRFDCYELCVQSPRHVVALLRSIHAGNPRVIREDFSGTAAVARRWCAEGLKAGDDSRAVCVDIDPGVLSRARARAERDGVAPRMHFQCADAIRVPLADPSAPDAPDPDAADVIFTGNFAIGYLHDRATLLDYLRRSRQRLERGNAGFGGGVFTCDLYGGSSAFRTGSLDRRHPGPAGEVIHYHWAHEAADPVTGMVRNSISFRVEAGGQIVAEMPRAFVYDWRLWGLPELRDAMLDAGFARVDVYQDLNVAPGQPATPVRDPARLGADWIVLLAARAR